MNYISVNTLMHSPPLQCFTVYHFYEGRSPQSHAVTAGSSTEPSHCCIYKPVSSNMGRELTNKSVLKAKQTQEARQDNTAPLSTAGFKNRLVNLSAMLQA